MDEHEWVERCSARLHAQWPRITREQRDETARQLWREEERWRTQDPEQAAADWVCQGIPNAV